MHDRLALSPTQQDLFQLQEIYHIFPEYFLLKVNNFNDNTQDRLDEWIYFLKNSEIKDEFSAQGLPEAKERLTEERLPEPERENYKRYLKDKQYKSSVISTSWAAGELVGLKKGLKKGERQGRQAQQREIAKSMKDTGSPIDFIAKVTGLSPDEVKGL